MKAHLPSDSSLPTPNEEARLHSTRLTQKIIQHLQQENNRMSFAEYMHSALYEPGLGYYTAGAQKLGAGGDFVTAPLLSPLFSLCLAHYCSNLLQDLPEKNILELGAGTGVMAKEMLLFLEQQALPVHYFILEVSADLRERQQRYLQQEIPHLFSRLTWLNTLPRDFIGVIVANEVLDALPVHLFHYQDHALYEVGVTENSGQLSFTEYPASAALCDAVAQLPLEDVAKIDYLSEINLQLPAFIHSLNDALKQGAMVFIDYGFDAHTYYHPHRTQGTLMCHYQHRAHGDVFFYPGLQDITAHVDFTALAQAGLACDLEVEYFSNQARFLLENGLLDFANNPSYSQSQQINTLTAPHEMGELFKVMVLTKGVYNASK